MNYINTLEKKYDVESITHRGNPVWSYLRWSYSLTYFNKEDVKRCNNTKAVGPSLIQRVKSLLNIFYGFGNWFRRYDYIAFSDNTERKLIDNKLYNKLLDRVIDRIGSDKVLYIERPIKKLEPIGRIHTKHMVSYTPLWLASFIYRKLMPGVKVIEGKKILEKIKADLGITLNDELHVLIEESKTKVMKAVLRHYKPKAIFMSDYYSNVSLVKAARDLEIKVIEFQHGVINEEHIAYRYPKESDRGFFPNYLVTFGTGTKKYFDQSNFFIDPTDVIAVGSYYLDYVRALYSTNASERNSKYRRVVGITLQTMIKDYAIAFVKEAALLDDTILYRIIPDFRYSKPEDYKGLELPTNVEIAFDRGFYQVIMDMDFHSTIFSTCALEAPSLGVQNIIMDIDALGTKYLGDILNDSRVTVFAKTPQEYVNAVNTFEKLDRDVIINSNDYIYKSGYDENVTGLLDHIGIKDAG